VVSWAQQQQLQVVAAMAPAVGPVHDALPAVRSALAACGIALHLCARPWEQRLTAMATSGFFPFWNRASQWLREESATHP
jgi:hypothetical protein